ncbi:hypothetical protein IAI18_01620 [Acetobacteraceae bacterium H6797]|nr:hypothetical protein [Acetobacteraceae bacterium H6797]
MSLQRLDHLARRYLASRGTPPMIEDPLAEALPRLQAEVRQVRRLARLDLWLSAALLISGLTLALTAVMAPLHAGLLVTLLYLHAAPLAGLAVGIWAAVVVEKSAPQWLAARHIAAALKTGALVEALDIAVHRLSARAAAA